MKRILIATITLMSIAASGDTICLLGETIDHSGMRVSASVYIDDSLLLRLPRWAPENADPPISITAAAAKALTWAKDSHPEYSGIELDTLTLQWTHNTRREKVWYYRVTLAAIGEKMQAEPLVAVVMMDGSLWPSVVTHIAKPDEKK